MIEPLSITLWEYRAIIASIYDGDTLRADIDLGFGTWKHNETLRLFGINTPELQGETRVEGLYARDALRSRLPMSKQVWVRTIKPSTLTVPQIEKREKYGRWLATIWDDEGNVNDWLVLSGHAQPYLV